LNSAYGGDDIKGQVILTEEAVVKWKEVPKMGETPICEKPLDTISGHFFQGTDHDTINLKATCWSVSYVLKFSQLILILEQKVISFAKIDFGFFYFAILFRICVKCTTVFTIILH